MSTPIRSFNRYELKYLLDHESAREVIERLKDYMSPDAYGDKQGSYNLTSLYYDTENFRFYWEKVEGIKFRRKLRIRLYESTKKVTDKTKVFVEIKQRLNRVTQKRRVVLTFKEAMDFCNDLKIPKVGKDDLPVIEEMIHLLKTHDLKPQCITSYQRQAFVGDEKDPGLRVTFDTNLRYRKEDLDLSSKKMGDFMLPADRCVMEVKVNDRIPYWLTEFVADHNIKLMRISKYCTALEEAEAVPRLNYQFA
jgi:hypothetical protein